MYTPRSYEYVSTVEATGSIGNTLTVRTDVGRSSLIGTTSNFRSRLLLGTRNPVIGGTALMKYMTISSGLTGASSAQDMFTEISLHNKDNLAAGDALTGNLTCGFNPELYQSGILADNGCNPELISTVECRLDECSIDQWTQQRQSFQ